MEKIHHKDSEFALFAFKFLLYKMGEFGMTILLPKVLAQSHVGTLLLEMLLESHTSWRSLNIGKSSSFGEWI